MVLTSWPFIASREANVWRKVVPGDSVQLGLYEGRRILPAMEVILVKVAFRILTGKHPHGGIARDEAMYNPFGFHRQMHILDTREIQLFVIPPSIPFDTQDPTKEGVSILMVSA